jgi:hypothetical protein
MENEDIDRGHHRHCRESDHCEGASLGLQTIQSIQVHREQSGEISADSNRTNENQNESIGEEHQILGAVESNHHLEKRRKKEDKRERSEKKKENDNEQTNEENYVMVFIYHFLGILDSRPQIKNLSFQ